MAKTMRLLLALIAAPLLATLPTVACISICDATDKSISWRPEQTTLLARAIGSFMSLAPAATMVALCITFSFGLGWHAFAASRKWTRATDYWIPGLLVGAGLTLLLAFFWADTYPTLPSLLLLVATTGTPGALTGLLFWVFVRPDRDAQPTQSNRAS